MSGDVVVSRTAAHAIVDGLIENGVDVVFGLPGIQLDGLFNALYDRSDRIRVVSSRHEQGVAYMALGYAQATGRPGVFAVVPGPGFLNASAALSTAFACGAPVLGLIGQIATHLIGGGNGALHEIDGQSEIVARLTKWAATVTDPQQAAELLLAAFEKLRAGRTRPVALEIPPDILVSPFEGPGPRACRPTAAGTHAEASAAEAARMLAAAQRPLMVVGGGALAATGQIARVADALAMPVAANRQGRGIIGSASVLSLAAPEAALVWADCDLVLAVGTRFYEPFGVWQTPPNQKLIRVDIDPDQLRRGRPAELAVEADATRWLDALLRHLPQSKTERPAWMAQIVEARRATSEALRRDLPWQASYIDAIRTALPDDGVAVVDYTQVGYVATSLMPVHRSRTLLTPGYQGTLGFAYATALGAKIGAPDRPVVCIVGDGGFMFTANELAAAVAERISVVTVVFVDGVFQNVRRMQQNDHHGRTIATKLTNPDFVAFAKSFGAQARRVDTPEALLKALKWGFEQSGPVVIEVPMPAELPNPWPLIARSP